MALPEQFEDLISAAERCGARRNVDEVTFIVNDLAALKRVQAKGMGRVRFRAFSEVKMRADRAILSLDILTARQSGITLPEPYGHLFSDRIGHNRTVTLDLFAIDRLKLFERYIKKIEEAAADPVQQFAAVDVTGAATGFSNWLNDGLYEALILANARFAEKFRRRHGMGLPAVERSFVIDPLILGSEQRQNLKQTLLRHLQLGFLPHIIYNRIHLPEGVVADLALLAGQTACDSGRIERPENNDGGPKIKVATRKNRRLFKEIQDRIEWSIDSRNVDLSIRHVDDIDLLMNDLAHYPLPFDNEEAQPSRSVVPTAPAGAGQPPMAVYVFGSVVIDMSRDNYHTTAGQAIVGRKADVHDNTFQQIWNQAGIDLPKLTEELGRLRGAMRREAAEGMGTPEQDEAIYAVADAEKAAAGGEGPTMLRHLKDAGKWALGIAEKIGVAVAAEAIKKAM